MTPAKQPVDFLIYLILLGSTIFVNKYVLSVLKFTYPTIFQGWQTLVGGILLRVLLSNKCLAVSATELDKPGFISLLPSFLFFSAGIVASSKALSNLSVPVYLCLHNTLGSVLYLLEIAPTFRGGSGPVALGACLLTIATAIGAVVSDIDMTVSEIRFYINQQNLHISQDHVTAFSLFSDSPYFWMLVYLACVAVQTLHSKIVDARYTEVDRLYFSYIFSVVVLAPASLYLEEAFDVLHFPHASRYDFYAGCLLSGVMGLFLNLSLMKVRHHNFFSVVDASGRLLTSLLALATFQDTTSMTLKILVCINLVTGIFVPQPQPKEEPASMESEMHEPLVKENV